VLAGGAMSKPEKPAGDDQKRAALEFLKRQPKATAKLLRKALRENGILSDSDKEPNE
jgi:hypothetical protein